MFSGVWFKDGLVKEKKTQEMSTEIRIWLNEEIERENDIEIIFKMRARRLFLIFL